MPFTDLVAFTPHGPSIASFLSPNRGMCTPDEPNRSLHSTGVCVGPPIMTCITRNWHCCCLLRQGLFNEPRKVFPFWGAALAGKYLFLGRAGATRPAPEDHRRDSTVHPLGDTAQCSRPLRAPRRWESISAEEAALPPPPRRSAGGGR